MDHLIRWIPKKMLSKLIFCTWTPLIRREAVVITMGTIAADSTTIDRKISMTRKNKKKRSHQQSANWKADHEIHGEDWNHPHGNTHRGLLLRGTGSPCPPKMNPEGEMTMKPDYRNWMPRGMIVGLGTATGVLAAGSAAAVRSRLPMGRTAKHLAGAVLGLGAVGCLAGAAWSLYAREMFSYEGGRQLSRQIIEGVASYIELPEGGVFAIHDLMEPSRYGDMDEFLRKLREDGFQEAQLLPTAYGSFMTPWEGKTLFLSGSALLVGRK